MSEPRHPALRPLLSERVCDLSVQLFALWTLCCHAAVAVGGSLALSLALFAAGTAVCLVVSRTLGRNSSGESSLSLPESGAGPEIGVAKRRLRMIVLILAASSVALAAWGAGVLLLWWSGALTLLLASATLRKASPPAELPSEHRFHEVMLWALSFVCFTLVLVSHRPDWDDSFYINVAVAAVDRSAQPLLVFDTLHGIEGLPLHLPAFRVQSWELFNAAISKLTGLEAIYVFHWISAAALAVLFPLAQARFYRRLLPRSWIWGVGASLIVLLAVGDVHRWYGNFSLVRIWQGKAIFLSILIPIIYSYGFDFARRPSGRNWLLLAAAQVASIGCSSSALWAAPVPATLGLLCGAGVSRAGLRRSALGTLSSSYVLLVGLALKRPMQAVLSSSSDFIDSVRHPEVDVSSATAGADLEKAFQMVLGDSRLFVFAFASIIVAWAVTPTGLARRFAILVPLAIWITLLNPYLTSWVTANVTGPSYWRALWAMPVPSLITLVLISPLNLRLPGRLRAVGPILTSVLLLLYALLVPQFSALSRENDVTLGWPRLKVPRTRYEWAEAVNRNVEPGTHVVAPPMISMWIPTRHHHAFPLEVRHYLDVNPGRLSAEDRKLRKSLTRYAAGQDAGITPEEFREGLDRYAVEAVLLRRRLQDAERYSTLLPDFVKVRQGQNLELWLRR